MNVPNLKIRGLAPARHSNTGISPTKWEQRFLSTAETRHSYVLTATGDGDDMIFPAYRPPVFALNVKDTVIHPGNVFVDAPEYVRHGNYETPEIPPAESIETVGDHCIVLGGHSNFGHWLFEYLPRLAIADRLGLLGHCPVALWNGVRHKCAHFLDELNLRWFAVDSPARFKDAWVLSAPIGRRRDRTPYFWPESIHWMRQKFSHLRAPNKRRRIYAIRRGTAHRLILNDEELITALKYYEVEAIDLAGLSIQEQIKTVSEAELLIMPMGASGPISMFTDGAVIELSPPGIDGLFSSRIFCAVTGNWHQRIDGTPNEAGVNASYTVNVRQVLTCVEHWVRRVHGR
jgi:capsular polysaccharide biosynthesis protein